MTRTKRAMPADLALERTTDLFAALAHPVRLAMLVALARRGPMCAGELQTLVGGEQSSVSHQLAVLRRKRLVAVERDGRRQVYELLDEHVAHIVEDAVKHANERV